LLPYLLQQLSPALRAELANARRKDRQKQGKYKGRKSVINQSLINKAKDLKENSNLFVIQIAKVIGTN
jgi:hypothetical protein